MAKAARQKTPVPVDGVDLDAIHQSIADLEALMASPGWAIIASLANTRFGLKATVEQIEQLVRAPTAQVVGEQTLIVVSARAAAVELITAPQRLISEAKSKLEQVRVSQQHRASREHPLGPDVEVST